MKNTFLFIVLFNISNVFCQNPDSPFKDLTHLSFNKSYPQYIPPPIKQYKELGKELETRYYENRKTCNDVEILIIQNLQSLQIDSINKVYRDGLKRNLEKIRYLKVQGEYADYTILLMDIIDDLKSNQQYYKDEDDYIKDLLLQEQIKKKDEEIRRLKEEVEFKKNINTKSKTTSKPSKKKTSQ